MSLMHMDSDSVDNRRLFYMSADSRDWMAGGSRVAAGSTTGKLNSWWAGWLSQLAQGRPGTLGAF